jgi:hypothetical protein
MSFFQPSSTLPTLPTLPSASDTPDTTVSPWNNASVRQPVTGLHVQWVPLLT